MWIVILVIFMDFELRPRLRKWTQTEPIYCLLINKLPVNHSSGHRNYILLLGKRSSEFRVSSIKNTT